jgi:hypothetical protein
MTDVRVVEVGPRDGLQNEKQNEKQNVPTATKLELDVVGDIARADQSSPGARIAARLVSQ